MKCSWSQCFRDTDGAFTRLWMISMDYKLYSFVAGDNRVYAWSDQVIVHIAIMSTRLQDEYICRFPCLSQGVLLKLTRKKERRLKQYGTDIKYFTFVGPTDETVATIDKTNALRVWDVSTGELVRTRFSMSI